MWLSGCGKDQNGVEEREESIKNLPKHNMQPAPPHREPWEDKQPIRWEWRAEPYDSGQCGGDGGTYFFYSPLGLQQSLGPE